MTRDVRPKTAVGNLKLPPLRSPLFPKRDNCSACPHLRGKDCPSFDKEGQREGALLATTGKFVQTNAEANLFALC